jgi:uncharacterized protein
MRILFLIAAIVIVFMIARTLLRRPKSIKRDERKPLGAEKMVRCDHCGLHVPEHEAILDQGRRYCSPEHQQQDRLGRDQ